MMKNRSNYQVLDIFNAWLVINIKVKVLISFSLISHMHIVICKRISWKPYLSWKPYEMIHILTSWSSGSFFFNRKELIVFIQNEDSNAFDLKIVL